MSSSSLRPETRYAASSEGGYVAYQAFGSGPPDLVFITHWVTNMDAMSPPTWSGWPRSRRLATMLFTDVVGSTRLAAERGDRAWIELLRSHDEIVREHLKTYRGHEVDCTGDGFLAIFDGPARAVTCAARMADALRQLGMTIRVGLHTGEIELAGGAVRGLAVHVAARVMSAAANGGIFVSSTVKDLVLGSGIDFTDRGTHRPKDVPGDWALYEVVSTP